jgi:hypothetical protein
LSPMPGALTKKALTINPLSAFIHNIIIYLKS